MEDSLADIEVCTLIIEYTEAKTVWVGLYRHCSLRHFSNIRTFCSIHCRTLGGISGIKAFCAV